MLRLSNLRLWLAIAAARIMGRNPEAMAEVRDAMNQRRRIRDSHPTLEEIEKLEVDYLTREAPDLIRKPRK